MFTYWRHFLRRSPQSASSSARRSMIRVAFGWIGARRPPARGAQSAPEGAVRVERAVELDLGVDPQVADPAAGAVQRRRGRRP